MIDRQVVWSNDEVRKLLSGFVLCADEVWNLQHAETEEAKLFRKFCELGHYGRRDMDLTRQGIYAISPSGKLLGSWNTRYLPNVVKSLQAALAGWEKMEDADRYPESAITREFRWTDKYPEDGIALRVFTRDMPRGDVSDKAQANQRNADKPDWRQKAWNQDRLWLSKEESLALRDGKGLPENAARRIVRIHGRDNARGQSKGFEDKHIQTANLSSKVVQKEASRTVVELRGQGAVTETGHWPIHDRHDEAAEHTRSFRGTLKGRAVWEGDRCVEFQLAWVGPRLGATQYNGRHDDPGPADLGVVFVLAPEDDRVPPSLIWTYGWH